MIPQIRSTGWHAWHGGDWGTIVGVEIRQVEDQRRPPCPPECDWHTVKSVEQRACFVIVFPDGSTDAWMIYDPDAKYEFRSVEPGSRPRMIWEERPPAGSGV